MRPGSRFWDTVKTSNFMSIERAGCGCWPELNKSRINQVMDQTGRGCAMDSNLGRKEEKSRLRRDMDSIRRSAGKEHGKDGAMRSSRCFGINIDMSPMALNDLPGDP
jgi:hypothetical protein